MAPGVDGSILSTMPGHEHQRPPDGQLAPVPPWQHVIGALFVDSAPIFERTESNS